MVPLRPLNAALELACMYTFETLNLFGGVCNMLRRYFCCQPPRLFSDFQWGAVTDISKLPPKLVNNGQKSEPPKSLVSPNRFRSMHEKDLQHIKRTHFNRLSDQIPAHENYGRAGNRYGARRNEVNRPIFEFNTGSERAQLALKNIIMKVRSKSSNYEVSLVDTQTKKLTTMSLQSLINKLDLLEEGIRLLPAQGNGLPIVRVVPVIEMLQAYTDELAAIKQQELLEMGSAKAIRAASMRAQAERKKSATKILTLSWSISISDLLNQKRNEIVKRFKKDEKLVIFIGEKASLSGARMNAEKEEALSKQLKTSYTKWELMDEEENSIEMKKREMIFGKLQEVLLDLDCKMEISGSLDARMMIKISSNGKSMDTSQSRKDDLSPKELKRLKKLERAKERAQEKDRKVSEEDIDSLYLLKIED